MSSNFADLPVLFFSIEGVVIKRKHYLFSQSKRHPIAMNIFSHTMLNSKYENSLG